MLFLSLRLPLLPDARGRPDAYKDLSCDTLSKSLLLTPEVNRRSALPSALRSTPPRPTPRLPSAAPPWYACAVLQHPCALLCPPAGCAFHAFHACIPCTAGSYIYITFLKPSAAAHPAATAAAPLIGRRPKEGRSTAIVRIPCCQFLKQSLLLIPQEDRAGPGAHRSFPGMYMRIPAVNSASNLS